VGVRGSRPLRATPDGGKYFVDYDGGMVFVKEPAAPSPPPPQPAAVSVVFKVREELDVEWLAAFVEDRVRKSRKE
jgi:hypothetical protein